MQRSFSTVLFVLLSGTSLGFLGGCGGSATPAKSQAQAAPEVAEEPAKPLTPEERLAGQWQGQMILDDEALKLLPADKIEKLRGTQMGMEFRPDGKLILVGVKDDGKPYQSEGTWQLIKVEGSHVTIRSTESSGKESDAVLMFEGDDTFLLPLKTEVANLGAMHFERLR